MSWAVDVARGDGDSIMTPTEFANLFEENLPQIVAVDPAVCPPKESCTGDSNSTQNPTDPNTDSGASLWQTGTSFILLAVGSIAFS